MQPAQARVHNLEIHSSISPANCSWYWYHVVEKYVQSSTRYSTPKQIAAEGFLIAHSMPTSYGMGASRPIKQETLPVIKEIQSISAVM